MHHTVPNTVPRCKPNPTQITVLTIGRMFFLNSGKLNYAPWMFLIHQSISPGYVFLDLHTFNPQSVQCINLSQHLGGE
jgi:hypothetical protein